MLEMQRLAPRDAQAAAAAPQRPPEAQRRDDEALPGAQGQPDGLVPAAPGADAGVHHHVPGPPRADLRARRAPAAPIVQACSPPPARRPPAELGFVPRYISHDSASCTQSLFGQTRDELVRASTWPSRRPRRWARGSAPGSSTPCWWSLLGRPVLPAAAHGRRPCRGQPDDVAGAAEADAVPAGRVRRLPGLLPHRPDHLLHGPGDPADRPAGLHHPALLRPRGVARPPGAAGRRRGPRAGQEGRRRRRACSGRPSATPASRPTRRRRSRRRRTEAVAAAGGHRAATKRTTPPKGRPTPTGKAAAARPKPVRHRVDRGQPSQERRETPALISAAEPLTGRRAWPGRRTEWMHGVGRDDRARRSRRPRSWRSTSSGWSPTRPSSRSWRRPSRACSAGCAARRGCGPGSARRRCARSRIAGVAAGRRRRDRRRAVDRRRRRRRRRPASGRRPRAGGKRRRRRRDRRRRRRAADASRRSARQHRRKRHEHR